MPVRYVLIGKFAAETGYTEKAIRKKIEDGVWIQGRHYRKAPDGRIMMDMEEYERWVEGQLAPSSRSGTRSGSNSRSTDRAA
jgi:hypothetical protein